MRTAFRRPGLRRDVVGSKSSSRGTLDRAVPRRGESFIECLERRRLLAAITSGQTITASIGAAGESDTYTISGLTGGSLLASVAETVAGSPLSTLIELYNPSGGLLTFGSSATGTTLTSRNLPANGTYFVTVRDSTGANTGGYAMTPVSV